jgi:hypothetical protein
MFQPCEQIFNKRADACQKAMELYPDEAGYMPGPGRINMARRLRYIVDVRC